MIYRNYMEDAMKYFHHAKNAGKLSRADTFNAAFNVIKNRNNPVIVELGTLRSFCTDPNGACRFDLNYWKPNDPSYWDWGSGLFSLIAAIELSENNPKIYTIDVTQSNLSIAKTYTKQFERMFSYSSVGSTKFLKDFNGKIDLLYMDHATDNPNQTQELHLTDAEIVVTNNLMSAGGLILIDDYFDGNELAVRCKLSLPYLLDHGFKIIMSEYQILLQKE